MDIFYKYIYNKYIYFGLNINYIYEKIIYILIIIYDLIII